MGTFSDYQREETPKIEPGNHRVVIVNAYETISKSSGNPMIVVEVQASNSKIKIKHYVAKNEYFNRNMTQLFDSFGIKEGDFEFLGWIGAIGAARLAEDDNGYLKVKYFIGIEKAESLPPWIGALPERNIVGELDKNELDDELPF